jgi:succinate dehydrogenase / fumarate reductase cytochrome b subunit
MRTLGWGEMALRTGKTRSDVGTLYRGRTGQWTWLVHRFTGVAVILFLFAHVIDTAVIGWGPEAYNRVIHAYENPVVRVLEFGLVAAVLFHAINGTKILLIDFFPSLAHRQRIRVLEAATIGAFVASMIPVTIIMGKQVLDLL